MSVQILDIDAEAEDDGAAVNEDNKRTGKSAVIKTSTRQVGLCPSKHLSINDVTRVDTVYIL